MLEQKFKKFESFFLLEFTKELIRNSKTEEIFILEKILKEESEKEQEKENKRKKEIHEIIKEKTQKEKRLFSINKEQDLEEDIQKPLIAKKPFFRKEFKKQSRTFPKKVRLREIRLPPRFQYIKPTSTNLEMNLGKLNPLIKDRQVREIECHGSGKKIIVKTTGVKITNIILTKNEINEVIEEFSKAARIPFHEGIFKVAAGRLTISAVISDVVDSKFIIKKIMYNPEIRQFPLYEGRFQQLNI